MAACSTKTCFASSLSPSWMPGTSMCVRRKSAASITFFPMEKSSRFARTIRCTAPDICTGRVFVRCWSSAHEPASLSITLARFALFSRATDLYRCAVVQHGDAGLLYETDAFIRTPAPALCAAIRLLWQSRRGRFRCGHALLHLYGYAALLRYGGSRYSTRPGRFFPAGLAHHQPGRNHLTAGGFWLARHRLLC